ncbi:MAG TPA: hypothetical protein IAB32_03390 [Candidatus Scatosoma pullicola]|nr:hypothetical protein [Candidatus Scatosoma pullicola]
MDVLYEESAVNQKSKKAEKKYKILNVISWIVFALGIFCALIFFTLCLPYFLTSMDSAPPEDVSVEDWQGQIAGGRGMGIFIIMQFVFFALVWIMLYMLKKRVNISYDYTFVSGELRIAKVFNINRRKLVVRIDAAEILQLGDVDNESYDRLRADPGIKQEVVTPNEEPSEGKFFMYVLIGGSNGRKMYVLECREELLVNILKFAKRGTLESDYVMQEKKLAQGR